MTVAILMVPNDEAVAWDMARWELTRVLRVPEGIEVEAFVRGRVKNCDVVIFASPQRRWRDVIEAVRGAARVGHGELALRFYGPTCTIDVRLATADGYEVICPVLREYAPGMGAQAAAIRRALTAGLRDVDREMREAAEATWYAKAMRIWTALRARTAA